MGPPSRYPVWPTSCRGVSEDDGRESLDVVFLDEGLVGGLFFFGLVVLLREVEFDEHEVLGGLLVNSLWLKTSFLSLMHQPHQSDPVKSMRIDLSSFAAIFLASSRSVSQALSATLSGGFFRVVVVGCQQSEGGGCGECEE